MDDTLNNNIPSVINVKEMANVVETIEEAAEEDAGELTGRPIDIFRIKARAVRILCSVSLTLAGYARDAGISTAATRVGLDFNISTRMRYKTDEEEVLDFDPADFCRGVSDEFTWPKRAVPCVERLPLFRSDRDVQTIVSLMKTLRIFRQLPLDTQWAVARSVQYMRVDRSRLVLRQGHPGYTYYFIFSGAVNVTFTEDAEIHGGSMEGVILRRGQGFGEVALLKEVGRTATVTSLKTCEFLVLYEDEFHSSGLANYYLMERERITKFVESLSIFSHLPEDSMSEVLNCCQTDRYLNDKVIVSNSVSSEHIWWVLDGSCDVYLYVDLPPEETEMPVIAPPPVSTEENGKQSPKTVALPPSGRMKTGMWLRQNNGVVVVTKSPSNSTLDEEEEDSSSTQSKCRRGFFVKAGHLTKSNNFGLASLRGDTRQLSLVSCGAEMLRIPKNILTRVLGSSATRRLGKRYERIPNDQRLRNEFDAQTEWTAFKKALVQASSKKGRTRSQSNLETKPSDRLPPNLIHVLQGPGSQVSRPPTSSAGRDLKPINYERSFTHSVIAGTNQNGLSSSSLRSKSFTSITNSTGNIGVPGRSTLRPVTTASNCHFSPSRYIPASKMGSRGGLGSRPYSAATSLTSVTERASVSALGTKSAMLDQLSRHATSRLPAIRQSLRFAPVT